MHVGRAVEYHRRVVELSGLENVQSVLKILLHKVFFALLKRHGDIIDHFAYGRLDGRRLMMKSMRGRVTSSLVVDATEHIALIMLHLTAIRRLNVI